METNNTPYFIALNAISSLGPRAALKIIKCWPKLENCFTASIKELLDAGLSKIQAMGIKNFNWESILADLQFASTGENQTILTWEHKDYPPLLKEIYAPPIVLYAKGK